MNISIAEHTTPAPALDVMALDSKQNPHTIENYDFNPLMKMVLAARNPWAEAV